MSRPHLLSPDLRPVSISSTRCGLRLPRPPLLRSPRSMDGPRVATIEFPARRRSPRPWTVPSPPSRRRSPAPSRPAVEDQHHRRRLLAACPTSSPPSQLGPGFLAVHRITNLIDLKRRLGIGRRCFGYFHPAIPGEPLIFIEVALLKDMATSIQEVLWDDPPIAECEAKCALFYSISSTQPGLSGINLGKFLLKRVIDMLRRDMPSVQIFATLSPIPGFMQWLLAKLASQIKLAETELQEGNSLEGASSTFRESILLPEEEKIIHNAVEQVNDKQGIELLQDVLKSSQWVKSDKLSAALKSPLMRLCSRYLARERKRGKALDAVANFHLQNGAMIERINWMADQSEKGIKQSGGIMVNYLYRLESIEEYALSYSATGLIHGSPGMS